MKERILKELKEFLEVGFVGALIGLGFGWACARDIDKDCERECGLEAKRQLVFKWNSRKEA